MRNAGRNRLWITSCEVMHQPHRLVDRRVNLVDFAHAVRLLDLPHPLLGDDVISSAFFGGVSAESWLAAAHQKMNRNRNEVATVQPISTSR